MLKTLLKSTMICLLILYTVAPSTTVCGQKKFDSSVPALLYHHIAEENPDNNEYVISPKIFEEHMLFLKENGYECISPNEYYNYRKGIGTLPKKPILITFDDGYYSNYQYAYPILKSFNMKATIFISTAFVEEDSTAGLPHFSWEQALEMEKSKVIDIQSHSHSHRSFDLLDTNEILKELTLSKDLIEKKLNKKCSYFAYPNGRYTAEMQKLATKTGYLMQFTTHPGYNTYEKNLEELSRIVITNNTSVKLLSKFLTPYVANLTNLDFSIKNNTAYFTIDYNITNNIKRQCDSVVVCAIYDSNNRLIYFNNKNAYLPNYGYSNYFSGTIPVNNSSSPLYTVKIFCLDSLTNLMPYTPVLSCHLK